MFIPRAMYENPLVPIKPIPDDSKEKHKNSWFNFIVLKQLNCITETIIVCVPFWYSNRCFKLLGFMLGSITMILIEFGLLIFTQSLQTKK